MKKLILIISFIAVAGILTAQSILRPVTKADFQVSNTTLKGLQVSQINSLWTPRLNFGIEGSFTYYEPATKTLKTTALSAIGVGIGFQRFVLQNDLPFNDWGFNALLMTDTQIQDGAIKAGFKLGIFASYMNTFNLGPVYDITYKHFGLGTNITFKF
jgi:hypothetical protein